MEFFERHFELHEVKLEQGTFRGIASVFGSRVEAWMPTVILPGAFKKTLAEQAGRIKLLWQHDPSEPIGVPIALQETQRGLEIIGRISKTQRGEDALILMRDGVVSELSVGFDPLKWTMIKDEDNIEVRQIVELRLWEISVVTFAADSQAKILEAASRRDQDKTSIRTANNQRLAMIANAEQVARSWGIR
jgi:HK97 family phage prohead protease